MMGRINQVLGDDELRAILAKVGDDKDKEVFGLVCKRWLRVQSWERKKLSARAGPHMLRRVASRFTQLHHLDLSQSLSRITDAGLVAIGNNLHTLQALDVSYCRKLTDNGFSAIAQGCPDLRSLQLTGCKFVTDAALSSLSHNCHYMEELVLQGCTNITDSGLTLLVSGCKQLYYLDVNKCTHVGDVGISSVAQACSVSLKTLKLLDCYKVGDAGISALASFCKALETLIIGGCRNVSDKSLKPLALSCNSSLKNLRMDWCLSITDNSVICILSACKNLEALDIGCCEEVSDASFGHLGKGENYAGSLKVLKICNCPKITTSGIAMLLDSCKLLEYIDVRSCPHITKTGLDLAGIEFPKTCKVNFNGSLAEPQVLL
ncbi:hypothetical protein KSS87_006403 [Heliosperma pusillum]|nr:hypothetical protein KSS87_006403 [Heliosperma pusillum]